MIKNDVTQPRLLQQFCHQRVNMQQERLLFRNTLPALCSAVSKKGELHQIRSTALCAVGEAFDAVHPEALIKRKLQISGDFLMVNGEPFLKLQEIDQILVVGGGKASESMAEATVDQLRPLQRPLSGIISAPSPLSEGHSATISTPGKMIKGCVKVIYGGHPIPSEGSELAARLILDAVAQSPQSTRTLIVALISGGASALLAAPTEGISLADKQKTTALALRSGAPITALNTLRKHLSRLKGGQLARAAAPRPVLSLILSDVIGDPLEVIASGPTVPDPTTFADCLKICEKYELLDKLPPSVRAHLLRGASGEIPDTPKPSDRCFSAVTNKLIGSAALSATEAASYLNKKGVETVIFSNSLQGEAREVAKTLLYRDLPKLMAEKKRAKALKKPIAFIATGEYTVTVRGNGKGGRNQEMLLALLIELKNSKKKTILDRVPHWAIVSAACDGLEGNSPACGAIIDSSSLSRICSSSSADLEGALSANNSYEIFASIGDAICCGLTGTNVNDILIVLLSPRDEIRKGKL